MTTSPQAAKQAALLRDPEGAELCVTWLPRRGGSPLLTLRVRSSAGIETSTPTPAELARVLDAMRSAMCSGVPVAGAPLPAPKGIVRRKSRAAKIAAMMAAEPTRAWSADDAALVLGEKRQPVAFALTYLTNAGYVVRCGKGRYRIAGEAVAA